jgi:hypothetical protein
VSWEADTATEQFHLRRNWPALAASTSRRGNESADEYRERVQLFGQLYSQYGLQLISSADYQAASDCVKRAR